MTGDASSTPHHAVEDTSPWGFGTGGGRGKQYAELVSRIRELQDLITACDPSESSANEVTELMAQATTLLSQYKTLPGSRYVREDISGREDPFVVPVDMLCWDQNFGEGSVQFSPFHHGGGGGVHGGAIALLFDDFIGRLANGRSPARTAYLHINYRSLGPLQQDLVIRGRITSREGRKLFLSGELLHHETLIADCKGLWVVLRKHG